jgi:hypothetical protein
MALSIIVFNASINQIFALYTNINLADHADINKKQIAHLQ